MKNFWQFFFAWMIFFLIEFIWFGYMTAGLYKDVFNFGNEVFIQFLSNLFIAIGIIYFVIPNANQSHRLVFLRGALFGLIAYGFVDYGAVYPLLQHSFFIICVFDVISGALKVGLAAAIVFSTQRLFHNLFLKVNSTS